MTFYDSFLNDASFVDSLTHTNLMLFILLREYILSVRLGQTLFDDSVDDTSKMRMYMYFYDLLRKSSEDPFRCISEDSSLLPTHLKALVHGRIDRLRDYFEAVHYIHPADVKTLLISSSISLDEDDGFFPTRDSVFGLFLRKFALGFHHQSFEEMSKFTYSFLKAYDKATSIERVKNPVIPISAKNLQLLNSSTRTHTSETALQISSAMGQLGGRPNMDTKELDETFSRCKYLFPELPAPYYAAHLLAIRKRNISEAVDNLCSYFETRMASERSDKGLKNTCAYMAIASANMHISFGHWLRGKCMEKEALKKSLESESGAPLNHLKITHSLLNTNSASFRYDSQVPAHRGVYRAPHVAMTELRTKFWSMVDAGASPSELLLFYFNSPIAMLPACFSMCLLDIATVWSLYGYPILYTTLVQCVINADCLQPCPMSDAVLSTAFAGMIKQFNAAGAVNEAVNLANCVETVLCRFSEKSIVHQARLQVELEQALRAGVDFAQCGRLVNALRLCCPWEAALYQAEVERLRGNCVISHDLLQHVLQSALSRLKGATVRSSDVTPTSDSSASLLNSSVTFHIEPFSHLSIPVFDEHVPLGGLAKLVQIAVRAQFALVELFMSMQIYTQAEQLLDDAQSLAVQYKLHSATGKVSLLRHTLHTLHGNASLGTSTELDRVVCEALHQSDRSTQCRCLTYISRLRLQALKNSPEIVDFLPSHLQQLYTALSFYRSVDDRRRILDILALLAVALNTGGHTKERNIVANAFNELRKECQFGATLPRTQYTVSVL